MPLYYYESYTRAGKQVTGTIDAPTPQGAKECCKVQDFCQRLLSRRRMLGLDFHLLVYLHAKLKKKRLLTFAKQLAVFCSGVPLVQSLEMLIEQFDQPFSGMLMTITEGVKGGAALADQLAAFPSVFSNVYVQLVKAGEAGKLEVILRQTC